MSTRALLARVSTISIAIAALAWALPGGARAAASAPAHSTAAGAAAPGTPGRIIISGAAGHLGERTVQDLLARGIPASRLILVSRTPDRLARYARMGASVRYGDFTKPQSLAAAFRGGTEMLLISIGFGPVPRPVAHRNAIDAAIADGVRLIAYTSFVGLSHGARTGLAADHYRTESILRQAVQKANREAREAARSGSAGSAGSAGHFAWVMLRNSIYMEELIPQARAMIARGTAAVPARESRIGYVSRADCAAAAAAVLATPGHDDRIYDITGPALIGPREVAQAASAATGRPIRIVPAAPGAQQPRRGFGGPALSVTSPAVAELTGRPATTLREFFERHRAELLSAGTPPKATATHLPTASAAGASSASPDPALRAAASPAGVSPASAAAVIARLRLQAAPVPVRERKGWRPPRKILLLAFDRRTAGERAALARVVPQARLVAARNRTAAIAAASDADVLIGFNPQICDPAIIDHARQLRWILSLAAGVEHCVAIPSVRRRNILITNMRGVDSEAIAEHAIALTLALAHGLDVFAKDTAEARWSQADVGRAHMELLDGKTMLVVGLGGIGTDVAQKAHALGMRVIATREHGHRGPAFVSYVGAPSELLTLARSADVIVNTAPLTPQTTGLFNARFFGVLKPMALFINVARGGSVVTADLAKALRAHHLGGAGLDVVNPEPLPPNDPLWRAPHVIVTPHIAGRSDLPDTARWIVAREELRRYAAGGRMLSVVDLAKGY